MQRPPITGSGRPADPLEGRARSLRALVQTFGGIVFDARGRAVSPADGALDPGPLDVHVHSGSVQSGDLFAALPGLSHDGVRFIPDAVSRGAGAVLLPASRSLDSIARRLARAGGSTTRTLFWVHPRAKAIVGSLASRVHGSPSHQLESAAVTGTNGKTSVCHLASQLLRGAGRSPAVLGTAGHALQGKGRQLHLVASHTTPDATSMQRLLSLHLAGGGDSAVMEASSHALVQGRLAGTRLRVGAFTNLTREHLDYHGTMERYLAAKALLWDAIEPGGLAVVHGTQGAAAEMARRASARGLEVHRVGIDVRGELSARCLAFSERGATFRLFGLDFRGEEVTLPLRGVHNVENALVSIGIARALGAGARDLVASLSEVTAAPGRLESVPVPNRLRFEHGPKTNQGGKARPGQSHFDVLVDYAHSPDALERVLDALRSDLDARAGGRLICVFGCGGDRDQGKREPMGRAVGRLADVAILTSDNPRGEDPGAIAEAVLQGIDAEDGRRLVELDRRRAIGRAMEIAQPKDIVLIAGKGHENTQVIGSRSYPFDDRVVAMEALDALADVRCASANLDGVTP